MIRMFSKVWLVVMIITSIVTLIAVYDMGGTWMNAVFPLLFVGGFIWIMFFIIGALMPWIER